MDRWVDEWMDGWVDRWVNGWVDGWIDLFTKPTGTSFFIPHQALAFVRICLT